jgi:GT2 family glycosyltransferase
MSIDVIIPNYNGSHLIEKNLPAVVAAVKKYNNVQILIVDDGSKPEEQKKLSDIICKVHEKSPVKVHIQLNKRNVGFASNVNRGAHNSTADFLVLLNSDVSPERDFLDPIFPLFEKDEKLFGVGCMDKSIEGSKTVLRGRGIGLWKRGFLVHARGEVDQSDTLWISGGSSIVRREVFQKLGGFDPLYDPFYWEDIDLSYRAQKAGYSVRFEKESIVEHSHNEGAIRSTQTKERVQTIAYRNQFTFVWKNITDSKMLCSHILWLPYHFVKTLSNRDITFTRGFFLAIARLPAILLQRRKQQSLYKISDREILEKRKA